MEEQHILSKIRELAKTHELSELNLEIISKKLDIDISKLKLIAPTEDVLVEKLLQLERDSFNSIFDEYNFDGQNAIDILLTVSSEINKRFNNLSPSYTHNVKLLYPEIYQRHIESRIDFIFDKIKVNIQKGIAQGVYRNDLSIELLSRLYISRLIDLHNPIFFPPEVFSFRLLFEVMFENFIRGIATPEGLQYFCKRNNEVNCKAEVIRR